MRMLFPAVTFEYSCWEFNYFMSVHAIGLRYPATNPPFPTAL